MYSQRPLKWYMTRLPKLKISWRRGKQYTSPVYNYSKQFAHIEADEESQGREVVPKVVEVVEAQKDAGLVEFLAPWGRGGPVGGALEKNGHSESPSEGREEQHHLQLETDDLAKTRLGERGIVPIGLCHGVMKIWSPYSGKKWGRQLLQKMAGGQGCERALLWRINCFTAS